MTNLILNLSMAAIVLLPSAGVAQTVQENVERSLGWSAPTDEATEIRVWLDGNLRVQTVYRIVNRADKVLVERIAWTRIERPIKGMATAAAARRETTRNRQFLQKERCVTKIVETVDHLWCKLAAGRPDYWASLFADLLPDELWKLPPQGDRSCKEDSRHSLRKSSLRLKQVCHAARVASS